MAIHNQVVLNGQVQDFKRIVRSDPKEKESKKVVQINIQLLVMRRPQIADGNKKGDPRTDIVSVRTRDLKIIDYLERNCLAKGDMLEVFGIFCTVRSNKNFICAKCGKKNTYEGTTSFVHPLTVRIAELKPKRTEIIKLTEAERHLPGDEINQLLLERKSMPGSIIRIKELGMKDNLYLVQITVREKITNASVKDWLTWMAEGSNRICIVGNLCNDPNYNPIDKDGGRVCTYQVGINRKVFLRDDDPSVKADYPWVKSLGEQAQKDSEALRMGSLVLVDGSIQAKNSFFVKRKCDYCDAVNNVTDFAQEIIPYSVEYLKNCIALEREEDDYPEIPEFLDMEEEESEQEEIPGNDEESEEPVVEDASSFEEERLFSENGLTPENRENWNDDGSGYEFHPEDYGDTSGFEGFSSMFSEGYGDD